MHTEVTIVLVQGPQGGDVRRPFHDLIHPFYGTHHLVSLFLSEDWRTLVLCNLTLTTKHAASSGRMSCFAPHSDTRKRYVSLSSAVVFDYHGRRRGSWYQPMTSLWVTMCQNALVHQQWVRHNHREYNTVTKTPSVNTSRCRLRSSLTCARVYLKRNFFHPWIIKVIPGPKMFWNNLLPCEKAKQAGESCMPA